MSEEEVEGDNDVIVECTCGTSTESSSEFPFLIGTDYSDCHFIDKTEEEAKMFVDLSQVHKYEVRGKTYLSDRKKLHTGPAVFRFLVADKIRVESANGRHDHVTSMKGRTQQRVEALKRLPNPPQIMVVNYQYPGTPPVSNVAIFVADPKINVIDVDDSQEEVAHKTLWSKFCNSIANSEEERMALFDGQGLNGWWPSDITWGEIDEPGVYPHSDFKNKRFKLIPTVVEGNFVVRSVMPGALPCLLGQKIQQRYFKGDGYIEINCHVGSSRIASNIISVLRGYCKYVHCQYCFLLQGENEDELQERVLACNSVQYVDYDALDDLHDDLVEVVRAQSSRSLTSGTKRSKCDDMS